MSHCMTRRAGACNAGSGRGGCAGSPEHLGQRLKAPHVADVAELAQVAGEVVAAEHQHRRVCDCAHVGSSDILQPAAAVSWEASAAWEQIHSMRLLAAQRVSAAGYQATLHHLNGPSLCHVGFLTANAREAGRCRWSDVAYPAKKLLLLKNHSQHPAMLHGTCVACQMHGLQEAGGRHLPQKSKLPKARALANAHELMIVIIEHTEGSLCYDIESVTCANARPPVSLKNHGLMPLCLLTHCARHSIVSTTSLQ